MTGHEELMFIVETIDKNTRETREFVLKQNGRVRKAEEAISALTWAVYIGGAGLVAATAWLIVMHIKP